VCSFAAGFAPLTSGFFEMVFDTGFADPFLGTGFFTAFLGATLAGFFAIAFFTDAFFAGLAFAAAWAGFLVADFPVLCGAGFFVGMLLPFF
jgi:hypothetical protein